MTHLERRLTVAYIVPDLGIGGAERHVVELMPRLDPSRFAPTVVCIGERGELFQALGDAGVPAVAFGRTKRQALQSMLQLVRALRQTRPDVVIVRGFNAELLGRIAATITRVPHIVLWVHSCHDITPRTALRRLSDRVLDRVTDAYFGVAYRQLSYMTDDLGYPEHKIRVIHNGVEPARFGGTDRAMRAALGIGEHELVVGILAALRPEKDHETFLRAAAMVAAGAPMARFLIVGDGERRSKLETLATQLGIRDRVVFTGARHDIPDVLGSMDVFVLSSFAVECLPIALLEAMASSLPAVCTSVGGIPEMVEDGVTGYLVPSRDPIALADRVVILLRSPELRRQFGVAARDRVNQSFSLRRSVRATERELLEVCSTSRTRARTVLRRSS
jgi:glycosyltransferase involved in cell wall biosynthesis